MTRTEANSNRSGPRRPRTLIPALLAWTALAAPAAALTTARTAQDVGAQGTPSLLDPQTTEGIDEVFARFDDTRSPGCALGVIQGGELVFARGYGMANLEHGVPLTPRSVFRTGSVGKQFTASTVALLALDGVIDLDTDVRTYLPELPDFSTPVTLRHLIHHTSGYRDYLALMRLAGKRADDFYDDAEVLALLSRQEELNFAQGAEYLYSNSGYFLLSQIVLRATGRSLGEVAEERIFRPLAMVETHYHSDHRRIVPLRAGGYAPNAGGGYRVSQTTLPMVGDGGVFTSVEEIARWVANLMEPAVGGQEYQELIRTRGILNSGDTLNYAFGLTHGDHRGLATLGHGGSFVGYRAAVRTYPDEDVGIATLCNRSDANPSALSRQVGELLLGDLMEPVTEQDPSDERGAPEEAPSLELSLSPAEIDGITGVYYSPELDVTWTIETVGPGLQLSVGNSLDGPLVPERSELGELRLTRRGLTLRFIQEDEQITGLRADSGRVQNLWFVKR